MFRDGAREELGPIVVLRCLVAAIPVAFMFSHADLYIYQAFSGPKPLYWVLAVTAVGFGTALAEARQPQPVLRSPVLVWIGIFLAVSLAWYIYGKQFGGQDRLAVDQALIDRFRAMALIVSLMFVFADPLARRVGYYSIAAATAVVSILAVLEAVGAIAFKDDLLRTEGRAAGFFVNPNQTGQAIAFGLALSVFAIPRWLRLPLLLVGACGVAATFSRSAMIGVVILVTLLVWQKKISFWQPLLASVVVGAVLIASSGDILGTLDSAGTLNPDTLGRLDFTAGDSGRASVARASWQLFLDSPLFGHGVAIERTKFQTYSHNTYVSLAADHGIVGLLLLPALILAIAFRSRNALPFAVLLMVIGVFSHNLLEDEFSLIAIALAAATGFPATRVDLPEAEPAAVASLADAPE
jgi:O-antigen ligase